MRWALRTGMLIDGTGRDPQADGLVVIDGATITYAGPFRPDVIGEATLREFPELTAMPGIIDAHVHTYMNGEPDRKTRLVTQLVGTLALDSYVNARSDLEAGVTTVRDCGSRGYVDVALKRSIAAGKLPGPRMVVSGYGLCITGGHMDSRLFPGAEIPDRFGVCDGPDEVRKAARLQLKMGADFVKVCATGGSFTNGDRPGAQQMTEEEMRAAVEEAHKAGTHVAAHAMGSDGIRAALNAGVDSIEHGFWLTDELIEIMLRQGTYLVPTLSPLHKLIPQGPEGAGIPQHSYDKAKAGSEANFASFVRAYRAGVRIAMGTDAGTSFNFHGDNADELVLMVHAGMRAMDVLVAATRNGAELIGLKESLGTIEPGKLADLLLIKGNPLDDMRVLTDRANIRMVIKEGVIAVDRQG